ncbi:serine palmitoyltransferase, long chain base subunit [Coelomomyces lativittatus]|nr:serine palmitoyltransferase, long chain base subunit [Coelomomyces lativittatus]
MLPIPVVQQVLSVIKILMNPDPLGEGMKRIQQLHWNAHYFRSELIKKGFIVYGHVSPVIPMLIFHPTKLAYFSRACLEKGIAVVVVGAPATPLILSREKSLVLNYPNGICIKPLFLR